MGELFSNEKHLGVSRTSSSSATVGARGGGPRGRACRAERSHPMHALKGRRWQGAHSLTPSRTDLACDTT